MIVDSKGQMLVKALIPALLVFAPAAAYADSIYLKNGRCLEGLVARENEDVIELEVYRGRIEIDKSEIEEIEKSTPQEAQAIRQKWQEQEKKDEGAELKRAQEPQPRPKTPKEVGYTDARGGMVINATVNKNVDVSLILDTGASVVTISRGVAEKLGIKLEKVRPDAEMTLADGRKVKGKRVVLKSVKVERVEAENVDAVVMLEEIGDIGADGLLGMSFLKRFNFKIDHENKVLILEKL